MAELMVKVTKKTSKGEETLDVHQPSFLNLTFVLCSWGPDREPAVSVYRDAELESNYTVFRWI